ncbi:MAG: hypothetical protein ACRD1L_00590 [Terriglobales bacterium]
MDAFVFVHRDAGDQAPLAPKEKAVDTGLEGRRSQRQGLEGPAMPIPFGGSDDRLPEIFTATTVQGVQVLAGDRAGQHQRGWLALAETQALEVEAPSSIRRGRDHAPDQVGLRAPKVADEVSRVDGEGKASVIAAQARHRATGFGKLDGMVIKQVGPHDRGGVGDRGRIARLF